MTDKENACLKQKYTKFRFEDSLRKYQPPPRKRVKIDGSTIGINAAETNFNSRLIRLCQTRKLYHATSRERASEFSRKKQAHQESTKKHQQIVSDFDEEREIEMKICELAQKVQKESNMKQSMEPKIFSNGMKQRRLNSDQFTPPRLLNFSFKQSCQSKLKEQMDQQNQSVSLMSNSSFMQMQIQKSSMISENNEMEGCIFSKQSKVKDIQFHIALVQQIHLKIVEQYKNLERLEGQYEYSQDHQVDVSKAIIFYQQPKTAPIQNQFYQIDKQLFKNHGFPITSQTDKQIQQQIQQSNNPSQINPLIDDHKQTVNISSQMVEISKTLTGRFHIENSKGACLFSARIFSRLCVKQSPNRITKQILKHHPYLSQSRDMLQMMAKNFQQSISHSIH